MAKRKAAHARTKNKEAEGNEEIDSDIADQVGDDAGEMADESEVSETLADAEGENAEQAPPTFAESKGSEANQHAKELAKKNSKGKVEITSETFYSIKGDKLLKHIAKPGKVFTIFVGSMRKHGAALQSFVEKQKKAGKYLKMEDVKPHMGKLQAELMAQSLAKPKKKA